MLFEMAHQMVGSCLGRISSLVGHFDMKSYWLLHIWWRAERERSRQEVPGREWKRKQASHLFIWCHGILGPLGDRIHAPDAISHSYQWLQVWELHPSTSGDGNVPQRILSSLGLWPLSYSVICFLSNPVSVI